MGQEIEVEATTATSAKGTSGSSKMVIEAIEGEEDGEDAGLLHHQAAPGQAPRHEQQPSTICLLTNPKCPIEAPMERVLFEYTKQNDKTTPCPIISTQTLTT